MGCGKEGSGDMKTFKCMKCANTLLPLVLQSSEGSGMGTGTDLELGMLLKSPHTPNLKKAFMLSVTAKSSFCGPLWINFYLSYISDWTYEVQPLKKSSGSVSAALLCQEPSKTGLASKLLKLSSHPHHHRSENPHVNEHHSWKNLSHTQRGSSFWKAFAGKFLINYF